MFKDIQGNIAIAAGASVPLLALSAFLFALHLLLAGGDPSRDKNTAAIAAMVHDGASPIAASCAIGRTSAREDVCMMEMMKEGTRHDR